MDVFRMDEQAGAYQIHALPGRNSSSPATKETTPLETELMDGFPTDAQAGAYQILPLLAKTTEGAETPTINFDAGEAMGVAYDKVGGGVATMMELNRGIGEGKAITVTGAGGGVLVAGGDDEVGQHNFADLEGGSGTTTVVDVASMKADATIAEATSAAMQVAKEADDIVIAGSKLL